MITYSKYNKAIIYFYRTKMITYSKYNEAIIYFYRTRIPEAAYMYN
jgi:hypothetical protein